MLALRSLFHKEYNVSILHTTARNVNASISQLMFPFLDLERVHYNAAGVLKCKSQSGKCQKKDDTVKYCSDSDKECLSLNFQKRGWTEVNHMNFNWNIYWSGLPQCRFIFGVDQPYHMRYDQIINHFPNSMEISRKDLLVRNIKRFRKDLERHNDPLSEQSKDKQLPSIGGTLYKHLDFIPLTYILPCEYHMFVEQFEQVPGAIWIQKPCGMSQGTGITLINSRTQLKKFVPEFGTNFFLTQRENCIVSRYIDNPYLIDGRKFDMRVFVLVTSFAPLMAYVYNEGFCRFCVAKYDTTDLNNLYAHLTNVSIQKHNLGYNTQHSGKWPLSNLWLYLDSQHDDTVSSNIWKSICDIIHISLQAVSRNICNDRHCFEVFGYDIMLDSELKPWLIEVNSSPSLQSTTSNDGLMKTRLVDDVLNVVLPPSGKPDSRWNKIPAAELLQNFTILNPSSLIVDAQTKASSTKPKQKNNKSTGSAVRTTRSTAVATLANKPKAKKNSTGTATGKKTKKTSFTTGTANRTGTTNRTDKQTIVTAARTSSKSTESSGGTTAATPCTTSNNSLHPDNKTKADKLRSLFGSMAKKSAMAIGPSFMKNCFAEDFGSSFNRRISAHNRFAAPSLTRIMAKSSAKPINIDFNVLSRVFPSVASKSAKNKAYGPFLNRF